MKRLPTGKLPDPPVSEPIVATDAKCLASGVLSPGPWAVKRFGTACPRLMIQAADCSWVAELQPTSPYGLANNNALVMKQAPLLLLACIDAITDPNISLSRMDVLGAAIRGALQEPQL